MSKVQSVKSLETYFFVKELWRKNTFILRSYKGKWHFRAAAKFNYSDTGVDSLLSSSTRNCDHIPDYPRSQSILFCSSLYFSFQESNAKEKEFWIFECERISEASNADLLSDVLSYLRVITQSWCYKLIGALLCEDRDCWKTRWYLRNRDSFVGWCVRTVLMLITSQCRCGLFCGRWSAISETWYSQK